jgi:hypothetical protein
MRKLDSPVWCSGYFSFDSFKMKTNKIKKYEDDLKTRCIWNIKDGDDVKDERKKNFEQKR